MNILFWNQQYLPDIGGVEILTQRLGTRMMAQGHHVTVITGGKPSQSPMETIDGIDVHRFSFLEALDPRGADPLTNFGKLTGIISAVSGIKRAIKPDIIHVNVSDPSPFFHLRSESAWNCPVVLTFQAAVDSPALGRSGMLKSLMKGARAMIAHSHAAARNVARHTGTAENDIHVIPPGVPAEDFIARDPIHPGERPTFAVLGRVIDYKGIDTVIDAVDLLKGKVQVRIIGDGPHRAQFQQDVEARGLSGLVRFEGRVEDNQRRELLKRCWAIVVPSRHEELFGMVAVEGSLSGLPVIASRIGGLAEIVIEGTTGFVVHPGSAAELATAMEKLADNPAMTNEMGRAARARALSEYTIDRTLEQYLSVYKKCLS